MTRAGNSWRGVLSHHWMFMHKRPHLRAPSHVGDHGHQPDMARSAASEKAPGLEQLSQMHQNLGNTEILAALQSPGDGHPLQMMQQLSMNLSGMSIQATDMGNQAMLAAMRDAQSNGGEDRVSFCGESIPDSIQGHIAQRVGTSLGAAQLEGAVSGSSEAPSFQGFISSFMQEAESYLGQDSGAQPSPTRQRPRPAKQDGVQASAIETLGFAEPLGGTRAQYPCLRIRADAA